MGGEKKTNTALPKAEALVELEPKKKTHKKKSARYVQLHRLRLNFKLYVGNSAAPVKTTFASSIK